MRHNHSCQCEHDRVRYCKHCRIVHCLDCNQEWRSGWSANWYQPYLGLPYYGKIQVGGSNLQGVSNAGSLLTDQSKSTHTTCKHGE